jgi:hypothetical protein
MSFLKPHLALLYSGKIAIGRNRRRIWGRKAMFMICKYTRPLLYSMFEDAEVK